MSDLWVVTPYQNPCRYQSRLRNFRTFRERLATPLLVVEISRTGEFELTGEDGEIVIQIRAEDRIWQKECLINLGVKSLPRSARYVSWIDCDVVFETDAWVDEVKRHLSDGFDLVQPFSGVIHQNREEQVQTACEIDFKRKNDEVGAGVAITNGALNFDVGGQRRGDQKKYVHGHAWCATIDLIKKLPLYEKMICGGGDSVHLSAANGMLEALLKRLETSPAHIQDIKNHYFGAQTLKITHTNNKLFHLYHGDFNNRKYQNRHNVLRDSGFDPTIDLMRSREGLLDYSLRGAGIREKVEEYFSSRAEDE